MLKSPAGERINMQICLDAMPASDAAGVSRAGLDTPARGRVS